MKGIALVFAATAALSACSHGPREVIFTVPSPDKAYIARVERQQEGKFGSTRYWLFIARADTSESVEVFYGTSGWVSAPVWQASSAVLLPTCFGTIKSVMSVLAWTSADVVRYRTESSPNIRLHHYRARYECRGGAVLQEHVMTSD